MQFALCCPLGCGRFEAQSEDTPGKWDQSDQMLVKGCENLEAKIYGTVNQMNKNRKSFNPSGDRFC